MQKNILTLLIVLISLGAYAQDDPTEKSDTTKIKFRNSTIVISKDKDKSKSKGDSTDSDDHRHHHFDSDWDNFTAYIGFLGYMAPDYEIDLPAGQEALELNYPISRTFGFNFYSRGLKVINNGLYIQPGLGLSWSTYFFKRNINITSNGDTTQFVLNNEIDYEKYKLRMTYLEVPLVVTAKIGKGHRAFSLQAGAVGGFRIGSRVKSKHETDGTKVKGKEKDDFNISPFKADAIARIGVGDFGVYARYSLTQLFEKDKAVELYPFSIGIVLGFF